MEEIQCDRELIYGVLQHWSGFDQDIEIALIQQNFKQHLDEHVLPTVEKASENSALLLRPLLSAAVVASCPFVCDFIANEMTTLIVNMKASSFRNAGLVTYILLSSLCLVRCSLLIGRCGAESSLRCVVLLQVFGFLLISLLFGMAYPVCIAFGTKKFKFTVVNLLPFLLVLMLLIWSISLLRYVSTWSTFRQKPMPPKGSSLENEVQRSNSNDSLSTFGI